MNKAQKGFTLIELMIVIAIIGILAAIAIPQYQDYVTRSKITEGLNLAESAKTAVAETVQSDGHWGATGNAGGVSDNSYGLPSDVSISGKYVTSVGVTGGAAAGAPTIVTITYTAANVGGQMTGGSNVLTLSGYTTSGSVVWVCGNGTVTINGKAYAGTGATSVVPKYLPANCRP